MANIYNIEKDLLSIFDELEDNEGELTPELEEKLIIKQDEFKAKIKSYSNIIKMLECDIKAIKEEKDRLNNLQKSKEKTIERLKKIMIDAIEMFGNSTKTGGKYIDYGTGKVSMRNTQAVEVEEDSVNRFINRFMTGLKWYSDNNQLSYGLLTPDDIISFANTKSPVEEQDDADIDIYTMKDLNRLSANIDLDINIKDMISTEKGISLLRGLLDYDIFKLKAKADKKGIKDDAKGETHFMPVYAKLVTNKSITIK